MDGQESVLESLPAYNAWRLRARRYQQGMCNVIGKKLYDEVPNELLHKKIGFALYGPPTKMKDDELIYTKDKIVKIAQLKEHILQSVKKTDSKTTLIACLFIHIHCEGDKNIDRNSVVFRILRSPLRDDTFDDYLFVDSNCRNYKNWDDYLETNDLLQCDMCFPNKGFYSEFKGRVEISYQKSPACRFGNKLLNCLDNTSTVLGVVATGISVASLFTPAGVIVAPLVLGANATVIASGVYDTGRNIAKLVDSGKHDENLSLKNSKSRALWLGLASSSLGVASTGAKFLGKARAFFKAGETIVETESALLRLIHASSLAVSGVTVINSLINAVIKYREGTLERIDVLQFIDACYFFMNSLITTGIAEWLIGTVAVSNPAGMYFAKFKEYGIVDTFIDTRNNRNFRLLMKLIGQNKYMPKIDLEEMDRITAPITQHVHDVSSGRITWAEFAVKMMGVSTNVWSKFKEPITAAVNSLLKLSDATANDKSIFIDPVHREIVYKKPGVARQLCLLVQKAIEQCNVKEDDGSIMKSVFTLIFSFNSNYQSNFSIEFLRRAEYVCACVVTKFINMTDEYELARDVAELSCNNFNDVEFNEGFGFAQESDIPYCLLQRATFHLLASIDEMHDYYETISRKSAPLTCEPPCLETNVGNCHIYDCESVSGDEDHWNLLKTTTGLDLNDENATLLRINDVVLIRPNNENVEAKLVAFINVEEDDSAVGILTVIKRDSDL